MVDYIQNGFSSPKMVQIKGGYIFVEFECIQGYGGLGRYGYAVVCSLQYNPCSGQLRFLRNPSPFISSCVYVRKRLMI